MTTRIFLNLVYCDSKFHKNEKDENNNREKNHIKNRANRYNSTK